MPKIAWWPDGRFVVVADSTDILDLFTFGRRANRTRVRLGGAARPIAEHDRQSILTAMKANVLQAQKAAGSNTSDEVRSLQSVMAIASRSMAIGVERARIGRLMSGTDSLLLIERADHDPRPMHRGDSGIFDVIHLRKGHLTRFKIPPDWRVLSSAGRLLYVCTEVDPDASSRTCRGVALLPIPVGEHRGGSSNKLP
jgi:hypothetical protein